MVVKGGGKGGGAGCNGLRGVVTVLAWTWGQDERLAVPGANGDIGEEGEREVSGFVLWHSQSRIVAHGRTCGFFSVSCSSWLLLLLLLQEFCSHSVQRGQASIQVELQATSPYSQAAVLCVYFRYTWYYLILDTCALLLVIYV